MPNPSTIQAPARAIGPPAMPSQASPAASTRFDSISTPRPPRRSIARPIAGPIAACSSSDTEKNAKNSDFETCRPAAIGPARIAGR